VSYTFLPPVRQKPLIYRNWQIRIQTSEVERCFQVESR